MSPPRAHDSRPISLGSPDAVALLLDRIDRLGDAIEKIGDKVGDLERTCERIEAQQDAARSRISRETKRADDEDKELGERVRLLERDHAERAGEAKAGKRFAALIAVAASGGTFGLGKIAELLAGGS